MHFQSLLLASLATLALSNPLEKRNSWAWIGGYHDDNTACKDDPPSDEPNVKLKTANNCYPFAPNGINVGWSWGQGINGAVTTIKLFSDVKCTDILLIADKPTTKSQDGYCLTTTEAEDQYPAWNTSSLPILAVSAA